MIYNLPVRAISPRRGAWRLAVVAVLIALPAGCGERLDVPTSLEVTDVTSGWLDVGLDTLGRTKLVPIISFRLVNISDGPLRTIQLNGVFRRCLAPGMEVPPAEAMVSPASLEAGTCPGEDQEWGNAFLGRAVGREGLEAGAAAGPFTMESGLGYTGEQPRIEMLEHRQFVDVKVELFVRHRSDPWTSLNEYQIDRQLLTQ